MTKWAPVIQLGGISSIEGKRVLKGKLHLTNEESLEREAITIHLSVAYAPEASLQSARESLVTRGREVLLSALEALPLDRPQEIEALDQPFDFQASEFS